MVDLELIAACGLNCSDCPIFRARSDRDLAEQIAGELRDQDTHISPEEIRCLGCKGDREAHWSPECPILNCCVVEKGLQFCFRCQEFPCERLIVWKEKNRRYMKAFQRLRSMREQMEQQD